jgi:hypothetical protein
MLLFKTNADEMTKETVKTSCGQRRERYTRIKGTPKTKNAGMQQQNSHQYSYRFLDIPVSSEVNAAGGPSTRVALPSVSCSDMPTTIAMHNDSGISDPGYAKILSLINVPMSKKPVFAQATCPECKLEMTPRGCQNVKLTQVPFQMVLLVTDSGGNFEIKSSLPAEVGCCHVVSSSCLLGLLPTLIP